jgi:uncharacterized protein
MISRALTAALRDSPKSVLLIGPRQTGKSTLVQSLSPDLEINLADEQTYLQFASNPGELDGRLAVGEIETVFLDEVQRLPSILNTVQVLIDRSRRRHRRLKFYLTGSSARKLKRGKANLLPGRIFSYELGPLVAAELDYEMDSARVLSTGCLPEPYLEGDRRYKEKLVGTYAAIYVKEEIQAEALTRNLEGFSRFLTVAAETSGRFLDFSKIASKAKVARRSAVRYFEILEDTLIARRLGPFPHAPEADLVKHPRYFFFDGGVLNGLLGNFTASADRIGNLFEHLLFNQIHHSSKAKDLEARIWNFRTRGGIEIDFVVEVAGALWAIEAKASDPGRSDTGALESFRRYVRKDHRSVIATLKGPRKKIGSVEVMPWQHLLREMGL